jgi:hypothetical protein
VAPITDVLRADTKKFLWRKAQEAAILSITILFHSGKVSILSHYNPNHPALLGPDASEFAIAGILS